MKEKIKISLYNAAGKSVDEIDLDPSVFNGIVNTAVMYQAVNAYRANQRVGLASTKTRGEVSGGGVKPWRQKGTGRARVGSIRSPLWRGGGVIFGPHPRDYTIRIPPKIRNLALQSSLNVKLKENNFVLIEDITIVVPKTKEAKALISKLNQDSSALGREPVSVLVIVDKPDLNIRLAFRNLKNVQVNLAKDVHCYDVLAHQKVVMTKDSLAEITKRLKKK